MKNINVIVLLKNFRRFWNKKIEIFAKEFQAKYDVPKFVTFIDFGDDFWLQTHLKKFSSLFCNVIGTNNVLKYQGFPTHIESDLLHVLCMS